MEVLIKLCLLLLQVMKQSNVLWVEVEWEIERSLIKQMCLAELWWSNWIDLEFIRNLMEKRDQAPYFDVHFDDEVIFWVKLKWEHIIPWFGFGKWKVYAV